MTNTAVAPTSTTTPTTQTSSPSSNQLSVNNGLASLAGNFQSFLTLLTTQLQNQDPLNPTDTNQFTQQITSMTGVEQQLLSNQLLQQLVSSQSGVAGGANLMGDTVSANEISGNTSTPINGVITAIGQDSSGATVVTINGKQVPESAITSITASPDSSLASALSGL
ncbi:MAG TPA: flagellar hook capping FlgD N-terminal domain-containing protein [Caulobacteraceae bacterium]|jgi:flagellar basal-body rod modification protein FlgD